MSLLFLSGLSMSSYFLALCYVLMSFLTFSKFSQLKQRLQQHSAETSELLIPKSAEKLRLELSPESCSSSTGNSSTLNSQQKFNTLQLLILSIGLGDSLVLICHLLRINLLFLGCIFRCMSFSTLCFLDFQNPHSSSSSSVIVNDKMHAIASKHDKDQKDMLFYNKVVAVLFNLPDYIFVSSYLLVVLVWAEAFQSSRRHWFSAIQFRRQWMVFYLIFNGLLYLTQVILYSLLFLYDDGGIFVDETGKQLSLIPGLIFYCVAIADLLLPLIILLSWMYLMLSLSGFPFKSPAAKYRLSRVGKLAMAWSLGRILYSVMIFLTFTKGWFNVDKNNSTVQSMVLVSVYVVAELSPVYLSLDSELLTMLSSDHEYYFAFILLFKWFNLTSYYLD